MILAARLEVRPLAGTEAARAPQPRAPPMRPNSSAKKSEKSAASPGANPRPENSKPASQSGGGRNSWPGW